MKVISFSLWGDDLKYTAGALRNAELAAMIYPGWRCRFYCGSSVPAEIVAQLEAMPHVDAVRMVEPGDWRGMFWRFYPASDSDVAVMLSRDTDSRLTARERAAVDAWLASDRDFHTMRDHPQHCVSILGGMWGVRNGLLRDMRELIDAYQQENRWQVDQEFLNTVIAPRVCERWVEHDEYFAHRPFPCARVGRQFVGQPFDGLGHPLSERPTRLAYAAQRARDRWRRLIIRLRTSRRWRLRSTDVAVRPLPRRPHASGVRPAGPRKWAVLAVNDQPGYLYYAPIVTWQWRRLGYDVLLLYDGERPRSHPALAMTEQLGGTVLDLPLWPGRDQSPTYCQVSRLFAATFTDIIQPNDMLTTSDVDMLVFREPPSQEGAITSWGYDLTPLKEYPICYVTAAAGDWLKLFDLNADDTITTAMERFVRRWPGYFGALKTRWTIDQHALTECINAWRNGRRGPYLGKRRTTEPGSFLPRGRLDRYNWGYPAGEIIDCHLPYDGYSDDVDAKLRELFSRLGLAAETEWIANYRRDFLRAMHV